MATKTAKATEKVSNEQAIVLQAGMSLEELMTKEIALFIESVTQQIESEDPTMQETATMFSREYVGSLIDDRKVEVEKKPDILAIRDRLAEIYFAYLERAARVRKAVQRAEAVARGDERFAECIRGSIEAYMLCSWDVRKISGY